MYACMYVHMCVYTHVMWYQLYLSLMIRWDATGGMHLKIINENISSATRNVFTLIISNKERKKTNITIYKKCYIEQSYKSRDMEVKAEEMNWKQTKKKKKNEGNAPAVLGVFCISMSVNTTKHWTQSSNLQSFSVYHGFIQVLTVIFEHQMCRHSTGGGLLVVFWGLAQKLKSLPIILRTWLQWLPHVTWCWTYVQTHNVCTVSIQTGILKPANICRS